MIQLHAVTKTLLADLDTPVSAYLRLCQGESQSFLFESSETVEGLGRFSVIAWAPLATLRLTSLGAELDRGDGVRMLAPKEFIAQARILLAEFKAPELPYLPFVGSLVGYMGHDLVRLVERLPPGPQGDLPVADLCYPSCFAVFDHQARRFFLVALSTSRDEAQARVSDMERRLALPLPAMTRGKNLNVSEPPRDRYIGAVRQAKEYIAAGDIFQVVLSDQFRGPAELDPLAAYRWLRVRSPSPYMFFLKYPYLTLAGSSPETLVKVEDGRLLLRPIAGTRRRSADRERDRALEKEMLDSAKERAEHLMLVDLARNDAGRVCQYGSIKVDPFMQVERFSHVMHLTSEVTGRLRPELDNLDALLACFPAGTVSGAPKVRALEIINELETAPRGAYGGAVGFIGAGGSMDTCLAIRMMQFAQGEVTLQAGAGIVADSVPEMEYQEIQHKAAQGLAALAAAAGEAA